MTREKKSCQTIRTSTQPSCHLNVICEQLMQTCMSSVINMKNTLPHFIWGNMGNRNQFLPLLILVSHSIFGYFYGFEQVMRASLITDKLRFSFVYQHEVSFIDYHRFVAEGKENRWTRCISFLRTVL